MKHQFTKVGQRKEKKKKKKKKKAGQRNITCFTILFFFEEQANCFTILARKKSLNVIYW